MSTPNCAKHPRISILSAVFNEQRHLAEMIGTVQSQDMQDWEILFVDDGSTDDTVNIIQNHSGDDTRIRLVSHGVKLGKAAAFNKAFAAASGDVTVLLAGDDRLPQGSLKTRWRAVNAFPDEDPCVGFFKIRTFSLKAEFDGIVLPRGRRGSRSGGAIAMNRAMAKILFPIDSSLVSEDLWLAYASVGVAKHVVDVPHIVLDYRIHDGNSHPRNLAFSDMNQAMHLRHRAWKALLGSERITLSSASRRELGALWAAEQLRYSGRVVRLLTTTGLPLPERLALASMASPAAYWIRRKLYRFFSGLRGM